ncbi:MAG: hypothetical protein IKD36_02230 [Clostridia bacterium]|nr:hypothetical protein [Clostridia bacterium]
MFTFLDKKNIEEVQEEIIREYSAKTQTAYTLPFRFSKPKKLKGSNYRVEMETFVINGVAYPAEVFGTVDMNGDKFIYFLNSEYESLGKPYKLSDGSILFGVKADILDGDIQMIPFDIDAKNKTYKLAGESAPQKQIQPGE